MQSLYPRFSCRQLLSTLLRQHGMLDLHIDLFIFPLSSLEYKALSYKVSQKSDLIQS